jgi:glycyl-tRNA synthetase
VDHETLTNNAVTIRERDSMKQERVPISEVARIVGEKVDLLGLLGRV